MFFAIKIKFHQVLVRKTIFHNIIDYLLVLQLLLKVRDTFGSICAFLYTFATHSKFYFRRALDLHHKKINSFALDDS